MSNKSCCFSEIFLVNNNKEYTHISTRLLEKVISEKRLPGNAANLWQFLFNKARFNKELEVKISHKEIALFLGKSVRTIIRYLNGLEDLGYIEIIHSFSKKGRQSQNIFKVRVPQSIINEIKQQKDRANYSKKELLNNITQHDASEQLNSIRDDKNVIGMGDKNVTGKNNIKINNINNNVVVSCDENSKKTDVVTIQTDQTSKSLVETKPDNQQKTEELNYLKEILLQKEQDFLTEKDTMKKFELNRQCGEIEAAIEILNHQVNYQQQAFAHEQRAQKAQENMLSNIHEMAHVSGPRPISDSCFSRLKQTLLSLGYQDNRLNQMINEIVQEARFGSLVRQQGNTGENSVEKAINIGLKLVREGRWQSPQKPKFFTVQSTPSKNLFKSDTFFVSKHTSLSVAEYLR